MDQPEGTNNRAFRAPEYSCSQQALPSPPSGRPSTVTHAWPASRGSGSSSDLNPTFSTTSRRSASRAPRMSDLTRHVFLPPNHEAQRALARSDARTRRSAEKRLSRPPRLFRSSTRAAIGTVRTSWARFARRRALANKARSTGLNRPRSKIELPFGAVSGPIVYRDSATLRP